MDGIHDLGGFQGVGPVEVEPDEPVFHSPWEGRVFGMTGVLALQGLTNTDEFRHAIERMDPLHYLGSPYYEHWLTGLATLLVEKGIVSADELRRQAGGSFPLARPVARGAGAGLEPGRPEPFAVGERVRVRDLHRSGHTRCPAYVRGRHGVVVRVDGDGRLPDQHAHGVKARSEPVYSVRFDAAELWGDDADSGASVCVDLWHSYLEPAP
jgi:nitrile hydratase beta subunit